MFTFYLSEKKSCRIHPDFLKQTNKQKKTTPVVLLFKLKYIPIQTRFSPDIKNSNKNLLHM